MERLGSRSAFPVRRPERDTQARRVRLATLLLTLIGTLVALGWLSGSLFSAPTARADSSGTITIMVPNPQDNAVQGPVGTNVTISGSGMNPSDSYQLGYASQDIGCSSGFQAFTGLSANTDGNGNFSPMTFAWPASVANVGTVYYICAQDSSNNQAQSQATFQVAAAQPPAITLAPAAPSSPGPAQLPGGFYPGATVQISGTNFYPAGVSLLVYITTGQIQQQSDMNSAMQLTPVNGQGATSHSDGTVSITVQIPTSEAVGDYYIYVVSSDSQQGILPSLLAGAPITLGTAPTPTPTATPAPTPTPSIQVTPTPPSSGPGAGKAITLFGLGGLSLALLILGVYLLASASALPRQG
jgi:hypothetical protein